MHRVPGGGQEVIRSDTREHDAAEKNQERAGQPKPAGQQRQAGDDAEPPEQQQRQPAKHQHIRADKQRTRFLGGG